MRRLRRAGRDCRARRSSRPVRRRVLQRRRATSSRTSPVSDRTCAWIAFDSNLLEEAEADLDGGEVEEVDGAVLEVGRAGRGLVPLALHEGGDDRAAGEPGPLELRERVAARDQRADPGRPAEHLVEGERDEVGVRSGRGRAGSSGRRRRRRGGRPSRARAPARSRRAGAGRRRSSTGRGRRTGCGGRRRRRSGSGGAASRRRAGRARRWGRRSSRRRGRGRTRGCR